MHNNNWKNPWYWLALLIGMTAISVGSKYLSEKIEQELKNHGQWPE